MADDLRLGAGEGVIPEAERAGSSGAGPVGSLPAADVSAFRGAGQGAEHGSLRSAESPGLLGAGRGAKRLWCFVAPVESLDQPGASPERPA
ncbi:hypothetical protein ACFY1U_25195 [Streptomyces sp. NPDC001351]|uniref:hypothetical protein n=1 Tax=Streptomyces sp. NPDC001351 TaxID=3364564 RepID=UPI0036A19629